ncbi:hypothetical protein TcBrA4_0114790 [Trypanosoma cruzi]|nr:hypothetical protein TcBrA4_0114790 [Trypanosoma cruzi]
MATGFCEEIPQFLQQHVPILIGTHQSLVEALQTVRGQAEILPLECVRIVCISDADRMAQPNSQMAVPTSWWISLSNAVDVECQYIVSASRMYDEVDGWLQETLLQETPDVVNRYRQRDDTVWDGVQHIIEEVLVDEAEEYGAQQMLSGVEAGKSASASSHCQAALLLVPCQQRGALGGGGPIIIRMAPQRVIPPTPSHLRWVAWSLWSRRERNRSRCFRSY